MLRLACNKFPPLAASEQVLPEHVDVATTKLKHKAKYMVTVQAKSPPITRQTVSIGKS